MLLVQLAMIVSLAASTDAAPLSFEQAVELTLRNNERTRIAEQDVAAAQAGVDRARAAFFPTLSGMGTYNLRPYPATRTIDGHRVVLQSHNALNATLGVNATLFDAHVFPLYQQARRNAEAAGFQSAEDKRQLAFDAGRAFLTVLGLEQVNAAAGRRLAYARQSLQDAQARFAAQLVGSNDVTRAELEVATAEAGVIAAKGDVDSTYLQLGYLLVQPVVAPLQPPDALLAQAAAPIDSVDTLVVAAAARRLDLKATQRRVEAARQAAREPALRFVPSLGATAQARATNEAGFGRAVDGYAGLVLNWPLFDGGVRGAQKAELDALAERSALQAAALQRHIGMDVGIAVVSLAKVQAAVRQAEAAASAAERNAKESSTLYHQGLASALVMADASARLFEANVMLARQHYGLALAYLDLRAALGLDPLGREPVS